jgi:hypothetical protein
MNAALEGYRWRHDSERAVALSLIERASEGAVHIRTRLAVVANELRQAAATAGPRCDGLLKLASKFEQHSRPGDDA